jgi:hypothetical protein
MAASLMPVVGAAAGAVHPLLMGPIRDGTVLGTFSRAVIVGVSTESGPRVASLLARGATSVPNGVRLIGDSMPFPAVPVGGPVAVGAGRMLVGDLDVRVVRSWSTRVPRINPDAEGVATVATAAGDRERGVPWEAISRLQIALSRCAASDRGHELDGAVDGLIGLGRGLTPGGDDVLAGLLVGLRAAGRTDAAAGIAGRTLRRVTERTTLLSADLLRLAAAGEASLEVLALLRAIHRPLSAQAAPGLAAAGRPVISAINRILSIGHTSGADLATGLALGLTVGLGCDREAAMTAAGQGIS